MNEYQKAYLMLRGIISQADDEQRAKIRDIADGLREIAKTNEGTLALCLVCAELQVENEK